MDDRWRGPRYLRLRPDVSLRSHDSAITVGSQGAGIAEIEVDGEAARCLALLLPVLRRGTAVDDVCASLETKEGCSPASIVEALNFLHEAGLLFGYEREEQGAHAARLSLITSRPQSRLDRIAASSVLVVGMSELSAAVVDGLGKGGVRYIDHCGPSGDLRERLGPIDLCVSVNMPEARVHAMNRACVHERVPFAYAWWAGLKAWFGPVSIPRVTPCFACINTGLGRIPYPLAEEHERRAGSAPMVQAAGYRMAGVLVDLLAGVRMPAVLSMCHEMDLITGESISHRTLKNPRCEVCSRLADNPEAASVNV